MSLRQWVPASNDENVTGADFKADLLVRRFKRRRSSSIRAVPRATSDGLLQHCNAALPRRPPVPNEGMTIPSGVRGVSWTGEHNGDRVRHRSSGFHRRDFLFGALATVATRVNFRVVHEAYPFRPA
jgi:hypothetical protein